MQIFIKNFWTYSAINPQVNQARYKNPDFILWFTPIMIGDDFDKAVELLKTAMASKIVTHQLNIHYFRNQKGRSLK